MLSSLATCMTMAMIKVLNNKPALTVLRNKPHVLPNRYITDHTHLSSPAGVWDVFACYALFFGFVEKEYSVAMSVSWCLRGMPGLPANASAVSQVLSSCKGNV